MIRLPLEIQQLEEGAYMATSSVLPGFLVQGDTVEEVLELAPGVARSLLEAMREKGVPWPWEPQVLELPYRTEVLVAA